MIVPAPAALPEASKLTDALPFTGTLKLSVPLFPAVWPWELIERTAVGAAAMATLICAVAIAVCPPLLVTFNAMELLGVPNG